MENLIVVETEKGFNLGFKRLFGVYPNQSKDVVVDIKITKEVKFEEIIKLYLSSLGYKYKNNLTIMVLTKNGYVPFDVKYMRRLIHALNISVINYTCPTINGKINYKVFVSHLISLKSLVVNTINDDFIGYVKEASSYEGEFLGLSTKEEGEQAYVHYGRTTVLPIIINVIGPKNSYMFLRRTLQHYRFNYAYNGVILKKEYHPSVSSKIEEKRDNLVYLLNYLFGYDENIIYDEFHRFVTEGIFDIFKYIMDNYSNKDLGYLFIAQSYNREDFEENFSEFLIKVLWKMELDLPDDKDLFLYQLIIDKVIEKTCKDLDDAGRFVEVESFYEDSYLEEEE